MWIFTNNSFVSVVARKNHYDMVVVRGRVKGDVLRFLAPAGYTGKETEAAGTDYAVRCLVPRSMFIEALLKAGDTVKYCNFKNSVREVARHDAYMGVWHVMHDLQSFCNPIDWTKRVLKKGKSIMSPYLGFSRH
jgi:hypothetical protein